mmetsp:Transcript_58033/g.126036  ORF Transcript_58033/g.126036 Transcript_58033/m.126036 type:complete len:306 (+) Transcript_58033:162-1079(+)
MCVALVVSAASSSNGIWIEMASVHAAGRRSLPVTNCKTMRLSLVLQLSSTSHSADCSAGQPAISSSSMIRNVERRSKSASSSAGPHTATASCSALKLSGRSASGGNTASKPVFSASNCQETASTRSCLSALASYSSRVGGRCPSSTSALARLSNSSIVSLWIARTPAAALGSNVSSARRVGLKPSPASSLANRSGGSATPKGERLHTDCAISHPAKWYMDSLSSLRFSAASNQCTRASLRYGKSGMVAAAATYAPTPATAPDTAPASLPLAAPKSICCPNMAKSSLRGPWPSPASRRPLSRRNRG